ncbi:conserved hypothetical protein [Perkinsus marinus ATCC 50983]|uniref:Beta-catenin-like protein 1 N-terminal domain-containing protein n=1 Tax=Perkinsus marinus (strain ATCC 50983 / TXsc) TaxID=423536 RepID=C5LA49_PERM5|nr:conserved hypothetical protein [Perkinsus marinus ATCC 50983]EER06305.1 conserved hypothetical protein [Perkinsus marinus ATCC 50983]|eukprot:XP_002774489.1 conserved hypothetical protein [Perkinsus marinus ATCC 50983]
MATAYDPSDSDNLPATLTADDIQELIKKNEQTEVKSLDVEGCAALVRKVASLVKENQRLRIKHSDDPTKFLESEVSLAEEIRRLTELAVNPAELYPAFVAGHGGRVLVGLLQHANVDICAEALAVLSDLTEPEVLADCEDKVAGDFVESLVTDAKLGSIYIETLWRIYREQGEEAESSEDISGKENDEAGKMEDAQQATTNCLQTIENLFEIWPAKTVPEFATGRFVEWLVTVIKEAVREKNFTYNALFASELLSLLLQQCLNPTQTIPQIVDRRSLDRLLRVTNMYRHNDPKETSENELLENVFDALVLIVPYHQTAFGQSQGVQLMVKLLSQGAGKRLAARLSLRVLEAALRDHPENCKIFVEQMGLKSIFGLLSHRKATDTEMEAVVSIIYHLLRNTRGSEAARVLNKFTEGSFSKVDTLVKLREDTRKHLERRLKAYDEESAERGSAVAEEEEEDLGEDPKEARYVFALGSGLSQLQLIDLCLLLLCHNSGNKALTEHLCRAVQGMTGSIREVIAQYTDELEDSEKGRTKDLMEMVTGLEHLCEKVAKSGKSSRRDDGDLSGPEAKRSKA